MDNLAIARVLAEIGDLLEIKGENPFKIRAYRNASETVAHETRRVASLTPAERLDLPGIGKDIAAKIGELADTGAIRYHQELLQEFPPTILDLLRLQGVGPKTVALLYASLNIRSLDELANLGREILSDAGHLPQPGVIELADGVGPCRDCVRGRAVRANLEGVRALDLQ